MLKEDPKDCNNVSTILSYLFEKSNSSSIYMNDYGYYSYLGKRDHNMMSINFLEEELSITKLLNENNNVIWPRVAKLHVQAKTPLY